MKFFINNYYLPEINMVIVHITNFFNNKLFQLGEGYFVPPQMLFVLSRQEILNSIMLKKASSNFELIKLDTK